MKKFIFILGGAKSGKSSYAVELAKKLAQAVIFIATATLSDEEMREKIELHKALRPKHWKLVEEGRDISTILSKIGAKYEVIIIDCLGLVISNLLADNLEDHIIEMRIKNFVNKILELDCTTILVSNEVGCGIVPDNPLARRFRNLVGLANQDIAKKADEVIFMLTGIPIRIKNS